MERAVGVAERSGVVVDLGKADAGAVDSDGAGSAVGGRGVAGLSARTIASIRALSADGFKAGDGLTADATPAALFPPFIGGIIKTSP